MTVFWIVAGLLIVAALLFTIPPLLRKTAKEDKVLEQDDINVILYKDQLEELNADLENGVLTQEQFAQADEDLKRGLLENVKPKSHESGIHIPTALEKNVTYIVAAFLLAAPVIIYNQLGSGEAGLNPENARVAVQAEGHQGTIEEQIRMLQDRLQADPNDIDGWVMLARSYYFLKQYQAASDAYARTLVLSKESEPQLLADYADALAMASGRNMNGQPYDAVKKALAIDPNHQKALWLAATAAYQTKDYPTTLSYWETLLAQFPEGSENHTQMLKNIGEVKELMGEKLAPEFLAKIQSAEQAQQTPQAVPAASTSVDSNNATAKVSGTVSLDSALKGKVDPTDTVFVFARAASGPRMPLAIIRKKVSDLPIDFMLDDSLAMNAAMKLSKFPEVIVAARISKSGNAMPQSGDLKGSSSVIKVGRENLKIIIDSAVP